LEPHSHTDDTPQSRGILEGQLREAYGRVVYSHKTHEKCADLLIARQHWIRLAQIALSAITTGGLVAALLGTARWATIAGLIVSACLVGLNSYMKDNDLGADAQKHRQAAAELWFVREQYQSLLVDVAMREKPLESLQNQRDELVAQLRDIYKRAPSTSSKAYARAQDALKNQEDMTFSDGEIDAFLPKELKRGKKSM
jgi:alpha-beta hydrolase superfamily lysophospholipase